MVTLYSRRYYNNDGIRKLSLKNLAKLSQNAIHITILSAYYSTNLLNRFLKLIPITNRNQCKLTIVFNGFGGYRLEEQQDELETLENKLRELNFDDINIYLNIESPLFHTKLYRFETKEEIFWFIGSANATEPAFSQNEEILVKLTGHNIDFDTYVEQVIKNSILYNKIKNIDINCMVKFWRSGLIYYKPHTNIQFTFSKLKIPTWVKEELRKHFASPPFTNPGEPWGPFNLKLAMGIKEEDKKIIPRPDQWSIETCFGYWVPSKYKSRLDEKLNRVSKNKKERFTYILNQIENRGENYFTEKFNSYIEGVKNNLDTVYNNYQWIINDRIVVNYKGTPHIGTVIEIRKNRLIVKFDNNYTRTLETTDHGIMGVGVKSSKNDLQDSLEREFWRVPDNLTEQFKNFFNRLSVRLKNERHINRACLPLVSSTMPEIWTDSVAVDEFSESFFEYIVDKINMSSKPLIIRSMLIKCNLEKEDNWEDVSKKVEEYISKKGWPEYNWLDG